jgi:hypothetical protein
MDSGFHSQFSLAELFAWTKPLHSELNWLFVILDSEGDATTLEQHLTSNLSDQQVCSWWRPEGLWIKGPDVARPLFSNRVAVPFSACYVFPAKVKDCPRPQFRLTTDAGNVFSEAELKGVESDIARLGALAYAADGCGLQWVSANAAFTNLLKAGSSLAENG